MIYQAYQNYADALAPIRGMALLANSMAHTIPGFRHTYTGRKATATWQMTARARLSHDRPPYQIVEALVDHEMVPVREEISLSLPFCDLLHFAKDGVEKQPRILVVAPLSGHFSTLLRHTVQTLLSDHDVYITDWKNARNVPVSEGAFGFDDYVDYIIACLEALGPDSHVLAVCQPCVQALAAVSMMEEDRNPASPLSLTLMAGPIDTRIDPTAVNDSRGEWFEIYNTTSEDIALCGWSFEDDGSDYHAVVGNPIVQANSYFVSTNAAFTQNGGVLTDYVWAPQNQLLLGQGSSGDELLLFFDGMEIDRVNYGPTFPTSGRSQQLSLDELAGDNNNLANWCNSTTAWPGSAGDRGSPGAANAICP